MLAVLPYQILFNEKYFVQFASRTATYPAKQVEWKVYNIKDRVDATQLNTKSGQNLICFFSPRLLNLRTSLVFFILSLVSNLDKRTKHNKLVPSLKMIIFLFSVSLRLFGKRRVEALVETTDGILYFRPF